MKSTALVPLARLSESLQAARRGPSSVVAGFLTSDSCPWCRAVLREQLEPRFRSDHPVRLLIVAFDVDDSVEVLFPDGKRRSARQWGELHQLRLTPTLAMLDHMARPLLPPLRGYSSPDFYGAYLEDQITAANNYWQNRR